MKNQVNRSMAATGREVFFAHLAFRMCKSMTRHAGSRAQLLLLLCVLPCLFLPIFLPSPARADGATTAYEAARALFLQGKYDDALTAFAQVKANFPSVAADAQRMIGCCHQWKGKFDEAIVQYRKLLADYPSSDAARQGHFWLGTCYESKSMDKEAIAEFANQLKLAPNVKTEETVHKLATRCRVAGNRELAEQCFRQLRALMSVADRARAKRASLLVGCYLRESGRWVEAADHYAQIKSIFPDEAEDVTFQLAESLFAAEQYAAAVESYQEFVQQFPNNPQVGHAKLRVEEATRNLGYYDVAIEYLTKIASEGGELEADALLRQAEILGGYQNQPSAALDICQLLAEKFPQEERIAGLVEFTRGCIYLSQLGNPARAREHFQTMLTRYPNKNLSVEAACHLASCYYAEGSFAQARELFAKAATDYECPVKCWKGYARYMEGDCLFRQGSIAEARTVWEEVAKDFAECDWGNLAQQMLDGMEGK